MGRGKDLVGWKGFEEVLKTLPGGPAFEEYQKNDGREGEEKRKIPTTLVCFLGGITYAEISALRFLNRQNPRLSFLLQLSCDELSRIVEQIEIYSSLQPESYKGVD